jgi:hypothetical protein
MELNHYDRRLEDDAPAVFPPQRRFPFRAVRLPLSEAVRRTQYASSAEEVSVLSAQPRTVHVQDRSDPSDGMARVG